MKTKIIVLTLTLSIITSCSSGDTWAPAPSTLSGNSQNSISITPSQNDQ